MILFAYIFGYGSLLIELVFFHVPSVANTQNFFAKNVAYASIESALISKIYKWHLWKKITFLAIPFVIINAYFLLPFIYLFPNLATKMPLAFKPNFWCTSFGIMAVIIGRIITFGSMLYMKRDNKQTSNSFKLHTQGIFAYSRNPGLDGMFLFFIGFFFIFPTLFMMLGFVFYFFYMRFRVQIEEEFLKQLFGEEYLLYLKKTKRFLLV